MSQVSLQAINLPGSGVRTQYQRAAAGLFSGGKYSENQTPVELFQGERQRQRERELELEAFNTQG